MNSGELDILLVEDNQDDMDLALHALKREKLANRYLCRARWRGSSGLPVLSRSVCASIV